MDESILTSVKKLLGIAEDYTVFDTDLIIHINSVLTILTQLNVGPSEGFQISDSSAVWSDFMGDDLRLQSVKSYVALKVRLIFDPPSSSAVMEAINRNVSELEWRIFITADPIEEDEL